MTSKIQDPQEIQSIYSLCAEIDIKLKKLKKKAIFSVGLSRTGKSTLYNFINQIQFLGVRPPGQQAAFDVIYQPKIVTSDVAEANNGAKSVTLSPNIADRGDHSLVDMPGYLDRRKYNAVIGVSWVIKGAFEVVEECQFILLIKNDSFRNSGEGELFKTLRGFVNMFNFDVLSDDLKMKIMRSVTFIIAKSQQNANVNGYTGRMEKLIEQTNDPEYGGEETIEQISFVMKYFAKHPEQIYLFTAAELGKPSPQCTIYNDHFSKRAYFQIKKQDAKLLNQKKKHVYRLPFAEDDEEMRKKDKKLEEIYKKKVQKENDPAKKDLILKPVTDLSLLEKQLDERVKSFTSYANILQKFFQKAINPVSFFDQNLNFKQEFEEMKQFIVKHQIYPRSFDLKEESGFTSRFKVGDPPKQLKTGIILARNAFELYKVFSNTPAYNNEEDSSVLGKYLEEYKTYLVQVTSLFRDTFCTRYDQEQLILQFLFVGVRGCREFSMLYEIRPDGKHNTCQRLKDSFGSIINDKPLVKIQQNFVAKLRENIDKVKARMEQNSDEIDYYSNFLKDLKSDKDNNKLIQSESYKILNRTFLELKSQKTVSPEQTLISLYENLNEHKKLVEEKIRQLEDDEGDYPENLNFKFYNLLSNMGHVILNLNRPNNVAQDFFAYNRFDDIEADKGKRTVQQYLILEQTGIASDIFKYIKDTESVLQAHKIYLNNLPSTEYTERLEWMQSMAKCCLKDGRTEQGITIYQQALKICAFANLEKDYYGIKQVLSKIPSEKQLNHSVYFNELKQKPIIDPEYDVGLKDLIKNIEASFIDPYQSRREEN